MTIEDILKKIMGVRGEDVERDLIHNGFRYEYEMDNYVCYRLHKVKVLYDVVNKCIAGASEIKDDEKKK